MLYYRYLLGEWWNGRHGRLKICCRCTARGFDPLLSYLSAPVQRRSDVRHGGRPPASIQTHTYNREIAWDRHDSMSISYSQFGEGPVCRVGAGGHTYGSLAQLVEHRTFNPRVVGSIPTRPTILFEESK